MIPATDTTTPESAAPLHQPAIAPHFGHALDGIWRISWRRVLSARQWLGVFWMTLLLAGLAYVSVRPGGAEFHEWTIRVYLLIAVPIFAFISGASAVREDMKPVAVDYLLTRPVPRPVFVGARFLAHLGCLQISSLVPLAALVAVGAQRGVAGLASSVPLLLFAQALALSGFVALGFFLGALSARYLIIGINYAALVEIGLGQVPMLSRFSMLHHLRDLVQPLRPELAGPGEPQSAVVSLLIFALFTAVWVGGAIVFFSIQEFAGQKPKDT